jgi:hypothetical protein
MFKKKHNIALTEPKEYCRVRRFAKLLRRLGCILDDEFERELDIYEGSDSEDSDDEEKNKKKIDKTNSKFERASLNNIYTNTKKLYRCVNGKMVKIV